MNTNNNHIFTSPIKWYESFSFKVTLSLLLLSVLTSAIIYHYIKSDGREALLKESEKLTEQIGSNAVNQLLTDITKIETLTKAQVAVVTSIENTPERYIDVLSKNLDAQDDNDILSGGYWAMPGREIGGQQNNVMWARNALNMFEYDDTYEISTDYLHEEWFNIARFNPVNRCAWSRLYQDSLTNIPKMTCAITVKRKSDSLGVATVDMNLSELNQFAKQTAKTTGGYVFITDKDNRFIAFGNSEAAMSPLSISGNHDVNYYSKTYASLHPVAAKMQTFDEQVLNKAKSQLADKFANYVNKLKTSTPKLTQKEAELAIATLQKGTSHQITQQNSTLFAKIPITTDDLLNGQSSIAYLFHVPETFWKLSIVIPNQKATAVADKLSSRLLSFLLGMIALLIVMTYALMERSVLSRVRAISKSMQKISFIINNKHYQMLADEKAPVKRNDEVGLVQSSVNALIDRLVENEGALANINQSLEVKVRQRTQALSKALKQLKSSQTQLIHSEKMSMLGQMVAGVSHEVNTPLGYVKNNVLLCEELLTQYDELAQLSEQLNQLIDTENDDETVVASVISDITALANEIKESELKADLKELFADTLFGIEQISELVVNLRDFSRLDEAKVKSINIHDCIKSALKIAQSNIKFMNLEERYDHTLPNIQCSPSQINQVLLNLFNNAAHATEAKEKRLLIICTSKFHHYLRIDVQDNGTGMRPETIKQIFEPFFTTKASGKGTGLGLAICKQIIEQHSGQLKVASKVGIGSRFSILLPLNIPDSKSGEL